MKKNISKIIVAVLVLVMAIACTACASKDTGENKAKSIIFSRGTVEGNTYTSKFMGVKIAVPEDWTFFSDEDIAALMDTTADALADPEQFEKQSEGELMDCYASSP